MFMPENGGVSGHQKPLTPGLPGGYIIMMMKIIEMKRHIAAVALAAIVVLQTGCAARYDVIRRELNNLAGKENVNVVLVGHAFFSTRWLQETNTPYIQLLKTELSDMLDTTISVVNTSMPGDTVNNVLRRAQQDILSYRPDIVIINLGLFDSIIPAMTKDTYRVQIRDLLTLLKKNGIFVVAVSSTGYKDILQEYDSRLLKLREFNEILLWEAGNLQFPVITIGGHFRHLRNTDLEKYNSMFDDGFRLSDRGRMYIMERILGHFHKAMENND